MGRVGPESPGQGQDDGGGQQVQREGEPAQPLQLRGRVAGGPLGQKSQPSRGQGVVTGRFLTDLGAAGQKGGVPGQGRHIGAGVHIRLPVVLVQTVEKPLPALGRDIVLVWNAAQFRK